MPNVIRRSAKPEADDKAWLPCLQTLRPAPAATIAAVVLTLKITGSYVLAAGKVAKVPSTEMEAVTSPLMGLFEKRRAKKFLEWVANCQHNNPSTHQGIDLTKTPMQDVFSKFSLEPAMIDFIGHALSLHSDDSYKTRPVKETYEHIMLYTTSVSRYSKSPYIYPLYGLDEIVYDDDGKVVGVRSGDETVKAKKVIGDPSYFLNGKKEMAVENAKVVQSICLLKHPIPNTNDSDLLQLAIPQAQIGQKHDVYIAAISSTHNIYAKGYYVAIVSTIVETSTPELELEAGYKLLGPIHDNLVYAPSASGQDENVFITRSYNATSHFECV
ncbi:GDP dissociation inhibitor-domain-containing protein [Phakopsora pachyrhizi]|uniref:GDP dissociation inhibitor-domain-containing protein n=1 Tax=Phakopsora pachyrhizi TaxID=170000 RepID=A0AAV0AX54_PHAPC|nr:GDP dissociation inhibitor-domain-containing protein [Phakopsora pachyrhizi]